MATYFVDVNGNISTSSPNKKKKAKYAVDADGNISLLEQQEEVEQATDEAVKRTVTSSVTASRVDTKKEDDEKGLDFFQSGGAFDDGYQFGDVAKTILGTAGDAAVSLGSGFLRAAEGVSDLLMYGVAGVADVIGQDEFAENLKLSVEESQTDQALGGASDFFDNYSVLGRTSTAIGEGLGQVGFMMAGGSAGKLAGLGAKGVSAVTSASMFTSSMGNGMSEAYQDGANDEEAVSYGIVKGAIDTITERLFSGLGKVAGSALGKSFSTLDDAAAKTVGNAITKYFGTGKGAHAFKTVVQTATKGFFEGSEEVLAGIGDAFAKKATYMSDEELGKLLEDQNLLEQFVVGTIVSDIAQVGDARRSIKDGTDLITNRTYDEDAVVNKEYEKRVAEAEKDGKLTSKEKTKIFESVERDFAEGGISIDTIEETLGGEDYKAYHDFVESEDAQIKELEDQIKELEASPNTVGNSKKYDALTAQLEELRSTSKRAELRAKLDEVMSGKVEGTRLVESYAERARRGQAFEADLSGYDEKQQETIRRAIDSGILNNTRKTHRFVDMIAKISADKGVSFDFTNNEKLKASGFAIEGRQVNGYVSANGVTININSNKALNSVVGHEVVHVLEGTEFYTELQNAIKQYAESKGEYQTRVDALTRLYAGMDADIDAEVTADLVGDYLFTDPDFIQRLSVEHRNVFQKIYDEIKYLVKIATAGSKEARQLEKAKKAFEDAYRAGGKAQKNTVTEDGVQYSVSETTDGRIAAVVDDDILSSIDTSVWDKATKEKAKKAAANALKQFKDGIVVDGITRKVNRTSRNEYTRSGYTEGLYGYSKEMFADKMRAADIVDDIVVAATNWSRDGGLKHPRNDNFVDFDHGTVLIVSGDAKYVAEVVVGITDSGEAVFYDVVDLTPTSFDIKTAESPPAATTQDAIGDIKGDSAEDIIAENSEKSSGNSDVRYSVSEDTEGHQLTAEQSEYFKDSKVVDEKGRLKVMYHGSAASFTVFDKSKAKGSGYYGRGFYFTDSDSHAKQYGNLYQVYLNITNPLQPGTNNITKEQLRRFVEAVAENEDYGIDNYGYGATVDSVTDSVFGKGDLAMLMDISTTSIGDVAEAIALFNEVNGTNYNGIIVPTETVAFYPEQIKSVSNQSPTADTDINHSISNDGDIAPVYGTYNVYGQDVALEAQEDVAPVRDDVAPVQDSVQIPVQESDYAPTTEAEANALSDENLASFTDEDAPPVAEAEYDDFVDTTALDPKALKSISKALQDVLYLNNKEVRAIGEVVQKYSTTEFPDRADLFYELQGKFGKKETVERNEEVAAVKKVLRGYPISVSPAIKKDIVDYGAFMRRNFGKVRFSKDGVPVDAAYQDLSSMFPEYFPADITNASDQLIRIAEVAGMEINETETFELSDEDIMAAVDVITAEVGKHKEAQVQAAVEAEAREAFAHIDDIAPVVERETAPVVERETNPRIAELRKIVENKDGYISERAEKLYWELVRLKKGVRASKDLGYLLDHGYKWKDIKRALLDIADNPGKMVNPDSVIESVARELLNRKYENASYELSELLEATGNDTHSPIKTVKDRLSAKLQNYQTELATLQQQRRDSLASYEEEISRLYAEYSKKRKNTKAANDILRRIDRLQTMKGNVDADYAKRISDLEEKVAKTTEELRKGESPSEQAKMRREVHASIIDSIKATFAESGYDFDKVLEGAKDLSTFATVDNTPQRVLEKALGYKQGQILANLTVNRVAQHETEGIRWLNSFTDRRNGLLAKISKRYGIKPGSKESAAAQMYAEGFYVNENEEIIQYGDAELAKDFPDEKVQERIKGLAKDPIIRQIYDETLAAINASRTRNAYPEIPRLDNYFLHFRAMDDTFSRLGIPFNPNDIKAKDLPTDLNGVTADLKPGQPYFASAMHRKGKRTSFDLLGGLERYLTGAKDQIYHIDDIQTLRALRNYIADNYGQAKGLDGLGALSEEEAEAKIKEVFEGHLSTLAKFLNEEANVIAGKTSLTDRGLEGIIGRRGITFIADLNKQVGANMVGFNVSSSLTNLISAVQGFAKVNKVDFVKAFAQTVANRFNSISGKSDGFTEESPVIIRRKGADRFYRTPWEKVSDAGYVMMSVVDNFSTELLARAKYGELTRKGMDSEQAHQEADKWVSRLLGDRSLGQQPQLYNSKMLGILTKFQLEVRNQLDSQFYDTIKEAEVETEDIEEGLKRNSAKAAKITSVFFQLAVGQHLFGMAFESIAGYNPAFDIIDVLSKLFGFDDDEEDEDTALDNVEQAFLALLEDLPYTSTFTGGRIPISSAVPVEQLVTGKDDYGNEKSRWETITEAAPYYLLPGGYGQIKKTTQGLSMFSEKDKPSYYAVDEDGNISQNFVTGSYTDSGNLRFPVEDTVVNRVQAALFGQYASENAREYFDEELAPLKQNQIIEYDMLDLPISEYWSYRQGLAKQDDLEDKLDYINSLDLPMDKKNIMANNVADRESYIDMTNYDDFDSLDEFDFATKNPEKYAFFEQSGITYAAYANGDADVKRAYNWAYENPEKYIVSKAISNDFLTYYQYKSDLNDIEADKDANGDTITGTGKAKKIAYINSLDIDYGAKIILLRSLYSSKEDKANYNAAIVEYLNNREDITYDEMVTILQELDFTVYPDGTVVW